MIKVKSWIWWLTIFANPYVTTTIAQDIYVRKDFFSFSKATQEKILKHEQYHIKQQEQYGVIVFLFLYILVFPFFYNQWRYRWEYEAYTKSGTSVQKTKEYISSWHYGWLREP